MSVSCTIRSSKYHDEEMQSLTANASNPSNSPSSAPVQNSQSHNLWSYLRILGFCLLLTFCLKVFVVDACGPNAVKFGQAIADKDSVVVVPRNKTIKEHLTDSLEKNPLLPSHETGDDGLTDDALESDDTDNNGLTDDALEDSIFEEHADQQEDSSIEDSQVDGTDTTVSPGSFKPFHGRGRKQPEKISLHLLGERHSGTNWMGDHLTDCFGEDVDVVIGFSDWKHWFQWEEPRYPGAVVVAQFRNVYNWVEAMRSNPYHAPLHFNLEWDEFVTKKWTMPRYDEDLAFEGMSSEDLESSGNKDIYCVRGDVFQPYQVIPCIANCSFFIDWDDRGRFVKDRHVKAFYELKNDGSGLPYDSILELRADKIRNFLNVENFMNVKSFHPVQYEEMSKLGTESLIRQLEHDLDVVAKCNPIVGHPKTERSLNSEFIDYLTENVDWKAESLVGYRPGETRVGEVVTIKDSSKSGADTVEGSQAAIQSSTAVLAQLHPKTFHGRGRTRPEKVTLHLLGERHTGTNWMGDHLIECFGDDVDFVRGFSDWKHWFQWEEPRYNSSVVVAQFRNVYNWVEAMRSNPYHSPLHFNLGWREFVTKPWTMPRYAEDLAFEGMTSQNKTEIYCVRGDVFQPYQLIPCIANASFLIDWEDRGNIVKDRHVKAFYELKNDGSGLPYNSILELRADKIRNFLTVENQPNVKAFYPVQYEKMSKFGTEWLIRKLEKDLNVAAKCDPIVGHPKTKRLLDFEFTDFLTDNVDWDAEGLIGYEAGEMY